MRRLFLFLVLLLSINAAAQYGRYDVVNTGYIRVTDSLSLPFTATDTTILISLPGGVTDTVGKTYIQQWVTLLWADSVNYIYSDSAIRIGNTSASELGVLKFDGSFFYGKNVRGWIRIDSVPDPLLAKDSLEFNLRSAPSTDVGKVYLDSADTTLKFWDGDSWVEIVGPD